MPATLEARRMRGDDPVARSLLTMIEEEFTPDHGPPQPGSRFTVAPVELCPPGGTYVALVEDGSPVAGGGVRPLEGPIGEVKRMYVVPGRRGHGLGRRLLAEIESAARDMGYEGLRLDTTGGLSRLYLSAGYAEIPDYNGNPYATFWGEKAL